jgi:hypothetical protein
MPRKTTGESPAFQAGTSGFDSRPGCSDRGEFWLGTVGRRQGPVRLGTAWFMPTKATGAPPDSQSGDSGFDSRRRHSNRGKSSAWLGRVRFGPVRQDKAKQHVGVPHAGRGSVFQTGFRGFDSPHPLHCKAQAGHRSGMVRRGLA